MCNCIHQHIKRNLNSWLYLQGEHLSQDHYGNPDDFYLPIGLDEISNFLNDEVKGLFPNREFHFSMTNGVFNNSLQKRYMFNEYALTGKELKKLYQEYKSTKEYNDIIAPLNQPSIILRLYIPCSKTKGNEVTFPMTLSSFFQLMKYQYEHPEEGKITIEDIPF